ncbi:MAG TPA: glycosyltransferase [Terriglobales bacterium]|nr:glycosyltransferase [Terriglobales bacterium]
MRNVVPQLSGRLEMRATLALTPQLRKELGNPPNISFVEIEVPADAAGRFCWEQTFLPRMIRKSGADVLLSTGNFALWRAPVPQILLSGNSLYTSPDFYRDLRARRAYCIWLDTLARGFFARRSVRWADCTVAPSKAFADTLRVWTGGKVVSIYHGFDPEIFFRDHTPLPSAIQNKIDSGKDALRLIFVSHYNYYRNFETLLRALPFIQKRLGGRNVELLLTCKLSSEENSGAYRAEAAAALVQHLGISNQVVELGAVPYHLLQHVIRACDIYVTPAYAETFAHPLVEAMACGLPVVASDLPVHREICRNAAVYFPRFSPQLLADRVVQVEQSSVLRKQLVGCGSKRSREFSWSDHVDQIISLAHSLKRSHPGYPRAA